MRIGELYQNGPVVSCEVFPPKQETQIGDLYEAVERIAAVCPDFISVTYGAGGGANSGQTAAIASHIAGTCGVPALAHLTCVGATRERVLAQLGEMRERGIENLLALRGDLPQNGMPAASDYRHADDLIREIRDFGGFCVGAACYPEGHIDCESLDRDIQNLLRKQEAGADFLISQLCFQNDYFYRFLGRARAAGVTLPISAGVMPILGRAQIQRMIFLCGASLPSGIIKLLHRYEDSPADLRRAGIEYAAAQIEGLLDAGVDGVHIYTMNKPDIAQRCFAGVGRWKRAG